MGDISTHDCDLQKIHNSQQQKIRKLKKSGFTGLFKTSIQNGCNAADLKVCMGFPLMWSNLPIKMVEPVELDKSTVTPLPKVPPNPGPARCAGRGKAFPGGFKWPGEPG